MTEYEPGARLVLEHPDGSKLVREVRADGNIATLLRGVCGIQQLVSDGWTVSEHVPAVEIPTERGIYLVDDPESPASNGTDVVRLLGTGEWVNSDDSYYLTPERLNGIRAFTRLAPVVETAAEVIDWMVEQFVPDYARPAVRGRAREHFGVERDLNHTKEG